MLKKTLLAGVVGVGVLSAAGVGAAGLTGGHASSEATATTQVAYTDEMSGTPYNISNDRRNHLAVVLKDVHGKKAAQVDITALKNGGNLVRVQAWNLTPGFHGIHIHAAGVCDPAGAKPFASAGGHFNPTGKPEGMQAGAFPVLLAGANGAADTQFVDGNFGIRDLLGPAGTAIVIHAAPDNYANIPNRYLANGVAGPDAETQMTGDAGARVACGVVSAPKTKTSPTPSTSGTHSMQGM